MSKTVIPVRCALSVLMLAWAGAAVAQEAHSGDTRYELPRGWIVASTPGILREPSALSKLVLSTEATIDGEPRDGFFVDTASMISGAGISAGPGYRRSVLNGRARLETSAAVSWNLYKAAHVSIELPHLLHDRLLLGTLVTYQDAVKVSYFGTGIDSQRSNESVYRFNNFDLVAAARLRATRWLAVDARIGWIPAPDLSTATGPRVRVPNTVDRFSEATAPGLSLQPAFRHGDVSVIADSRDRAGHPTTGGLYRVTVAAYSDQGAGRYSFRRYEIEAAQFAPLWTRRWVLALRGWAVLSDASPGAVVPFYLMPSLGGKNTLRGFRDFRFRDDDAQTVNVESRWALWTHMDVALFADAGTVAHERAALSLRHARSSYGAGLRLHNARSTLLRLDAGHSAEGWRLVVKTSDPFTRSTPAAGRPAVVPFVP